MVPVDGGKLKLAIADDGKGFAMHNTSKSVSSRLIKPFGPVSGGVSSIHSEPGQGTVVDLAFLDPDLKPKESAAKANSPHSHAFGAVFVKPRMVMFRRVKITRVGPWRTVLMQS